MYCYCDGGFNGRSVPAAQMQATLISSCWRTAFVLQQLSPLKSRKAVFLGMRSSLFDFTSFLSVSTRDWSCTQKDFTAQAFFYVILTQGQFFLIKLGLK